MFLFFCKFLLLRPSGHEYVFLLTSIMTLDIKATFMGTLKLLNDF